ncbi:MAG: alpha-xylosidase [Spirochaetales bacterium]|nr:alpha-xylosidase [Spirochaetales bacterium]
MKFTHGYWLQKPGFRICHAEQAISARQTQEGVELLASTKKINHRGDTLNTPLLTITYSAPMENVIGVKIVHHKGSVRSNPGFSIHTTQYEPSFHEDAESFVFGSGDLRMTAPKDRDWRIAFTGLDGELTSAGWHSTAYIQTQTPGRDLIGHETGEKSAAWIVEELHLSPGEFIYGLGERFTPVVRNGQQITVWNEDPGTSSEQAYKNIPFYLSNRGYGVFIRHSGNISMEIGSEKTSRLSFAVRGEELEYFIIYGPGLKQVLSRYTALTGKPPLPPAWSFGLWLSTSFLTDYDETTVTGFLDAMKGRDIPVSVFHFDCFWMRQFQWTDFTWDPAVFPDPEGMIERLHERGLRICVWINPYIAQQSRLFDEAAAEGFLLHHADGSVWQTDQWQPGMGIVDFTHPRARTWYQAQLKTLLDMGVDCFKTDFGERIPADAAYHDGSDPEGMHNYYAYLYNRTVYELLSREKGKEEAVVFARAATAGCQQYPVHWGGDCLASYDSMAESLRGGLSLCLSGFSYWSHDIGGFEQTATPDLYKRWAAFGLLSTHSRLHGSTSYRVPWNFDDEAVDVLRHFTRLKLSLMPYLYRWAQNSAETGVPLLRHMILEFEKDPAVSYLDMQYLLGPDLLVAPVFSAEGSARWYLPEGTWTHILSGKSYTGPGWYSETFDYLSLPVLARPGAVIPMGRNKDAPVYDYTVETDIHLYQPRGTARFPFVSAEGISKGSCAVSADSKTLTIAWENLTEPRFLIHGAKYRLENDSQRLHTLTAEDGTTVVSVQGQETGSVTLLPVK